MGSFPISKIVGMITGVNTTALGFLVLGMSILYFLLGYLVHKEKKIGE
ncbi:hypothetical protein [Peribacillus kribbensis]|nr:hypothetical protein [Peribacillus kribbensis]